MTCNQLERKTRQVLRVSEWWRRRRVMLVPVAWLLTGLAVNGMEPPMVKNRAGDQPRPLVAIAQVCAWPNLTMLPDGTLLATIHNQPSHLQRPGDVECWASSDGGSTWTKRGTPAPRDDEQASRGMFAAGLADNDELVVLTTGHADTLAHLPGHGPVTPTWVSRSADGGRTWSIEKTTFPKDPAGEVLNPFGDIVPGRDGQLRVAVYAGKAAWVYRSPDNGTTWSEPVRLAAEQWTDETALCHLGQGKWLAASRSNGINLYFSRDDARTWTHHPVHDHLQGRVTGDQQHPGHLLRLSDGTLLLTYGNRQQPGGVDACFSDDLGQTWSAPYRVLTCGGDRGYPSTVQRPDGQLVTAYYAQEIEGYQGYHMGVVIWDPSLTRGQP